MGTITIKIPQDIHLEYNVDNMQASKNILDRLRVLLKPISKEPNKILGLFADETELLDQITESALLAREHDSLRVC